MESLENRKYPRWEIRTLQSVMCFSQASQFTKNMVFSQNVSANGYCFRSAQALNEGELVLVYLKDHQLDDLKLNRASVIKSGNYFFARVVRCDVRFVDTELKYEIGCSFLGLDESNSHHLDLFTQLINYDALESISLSH